MLPLPWMCAWHILARSLDAQRSRSAARNSKRSAAVACPLQRVVGRPLAKCHQALRASNEGELCTA